MWLFRSRISCLLPWRWRPYVPPKRRLPQFLHGATSQKTAFFIVTAVKTSSLTHIKSITEDKWNSANRITQQLKSAKPWWDEVKKGKQKIVRIFL
jgi:hypothetical protein